ncbi:MAG: glucans biosynthesis glucosyltransferase MdoH [Burkholderiaceae bacterium]|nr:glucans biosynthesis glucosyltransferase MdoH [Burkholderiaceae bacterium]
MDRTDPPGLSTGLRALRRYTHHAAPPLQRGSMPARPWGQAWQGSDAPDAGQPVGRRRLLVGAVLSVAGLAAMALLRAQPLGAAPDGLRLLQVALFALLFGWVAAGFATALMGFVVLRRGDRQMLSHADVARQPLGSDASTAVIMPICNEHVATVFAGLGATAESLVATGGARLVEFYVLSDTANPAVREAEFAAWQALRQRMAPHGLQVHYRWRARRTHRKAGNVADFCRRWGARHRYMVVLDADSVMSGEAILGLMRLMEAHPQAGIIQSAPVSCGLDTLHARAQQFAGRVTGRLFAAGMQFWQLGESHYWGHNAIIRIAPFMAHCGLAPLPGRGGLSGSILSHDFVEAALMRRAGWQVWLVPDLPGSWEQQPPHLLAELQRDRRWCQGNLMNARLMAEPGLHRVHRAMLATGAMAYLSAPLWLGFVALGMVLWLDGRHLLQVPAGAAAVLWALTGTMLLLPRLLGALNVWLEGRQRAFGGTPALLASAMAEAAWSALTAPIRMAAHTLFVAAALGGLKLDWRSPPREAEALPWRDAARLLLPLSAVAAAVLAAVAWRDPSAALWLAPVALPLLAATPLAVWGARPAVGQALRRAGLLLIPEETQTATELRRAWGGSRPVAQPVALSRLQAA